MDWLQDPALAERLLDGIALSALLVWAIALTFAVLTVCLLAVPHVVSVALPLPPRDVATIFAERLVASAAPSPLAELVVERADARGVAFAGARGGGELVLVPNGSATRAGLQVYARSRAAKGALVIAVLALPVIVALHQALTHWLLSSSLAPVRLQVVQMVQAVHVLWPPFVLAFVARRHRRRLSEAVERALRNVPFAAGAPVVGDR